MKTGVVQQFKKMTKKLKWRLSKLPTSEEVISLLKEKLITQEEAKDILFETTETEQRDTKSLEKEIDFLKSVIEKLSTRDQIVQITREILPIYIKQPFYQPYYYWSNGGSFVGGSVSNNLNNNAVYCATGQGGSMASGGNSLLGQGTTECSFTAIKTF